VKHGRGVCRKPQQQRARAKYDAILQAAIRVLVEEGYSDASTVKIAQAAGVSVGTVYAYFADKNEIFSTYVDTRIGEILSAIASNVSMASYATVEEGIRDVIGAAVTFTMNNKRTLSAMVGKIPGVYDGMMLRASSGTRQKLAGSPTCCRAPSPGSSFDSSPTPTSRSTKKKSPMSSWRS